MNKDDITNEVFGNIDELSASLGIVRCETLPMPFKTVLYRIQQELVLVCSDIFLDSSALSQEHVRQVELETEAIAAELPALSHFIIPGENRASAMLHLSRAICRRAERSLTAYCRERKQFPHHLEYLNRLSSLLFAMARTTERYAV